MTLFPFFFKRSRRAASEAMDVCESIITEMGAEIHDDLIQKLSILRLHLDKIERSSYDPQETRESVLKMQADFQHIIDAVRRISRRLSPVRMENDTLEKRVEMLCQTMDTPGTVRIHPTFLGTTASLPPQTEAYLLRMIQELIHNAFRHSAAWNVWVTLEWKAKMLVVRVEDDGSGFSRIDEFVQRLKKKHNSLRMRADVLGARLLYRSGEKGLVAEIALSY